MRAFQRESFRFAAAVVLLLTAGFQHLTVIRLAWDYWTTEADYHTYLAAGRFFWAGEPIYRLSSTLGPHSDLYPPSFFLLTWPLTVLPDVLARGLWLLVLEAAIAAILFLVYSRIGRPTRSEGLVVVSLALLSIPVGQAVTEGQAGLLVAALVTSALWLATQQRTWLAGVPLAAAVALKVTPLLLVPYLLWRRTVSAVLVMTALLAALVGTTALLGWGARWGAYWQLLTSVGTGTPFPANQSIDGFVLRMQFPAIDLVVVHPGLIGRTAAIGLKLLVVALVVALVWRVRKRAPGEAWLEIALVLVALPMLQPFAWIHHWTIGLVLIPIAARLVRTSRLSRPAVAGLLVSLGMSLTPRLALALASTAGPPLQVALASWWLYAMLLAILSLGLGLRPAVK